MMLDDDLTQIRQALSSSASTLKGVTLDALLGRGWMRLNRSALVPAFRRGRVPHPERKA
jgi:hypothetical protein